MGKTKNWNDGKAIGEGSRLKERERIGFKRKERVKWQLSRCIDCPLQLNELIADLFFASMLNKIL